MDISNTNNTNTNLQKKYNFADGIMFFKEVFMLFRLNYSKVYTLTFIMFATLLLSMSIPLINVIAPLFFPIIFLMYIYGIHQQINKQEIIFSFKNFHNFKSLKTPFNKQNILTLVSYAGFSIIIASLIIYLTTLIDGGVLYDLLLHKKLNNLNNTNSANLDFNNINNSTTIAIIFYIVCSTIVLAAQYFSPLLILQQKMKLFKSLFFSLFTCYFQWKALCSFFLILCLAITLPIIIISVIVMAVSTFLSSGIVSIILLFLVVYYLFLMLFLLHLSQYYLYTKFFANII